MAAVRLACPQYLGKLTTLVHRACWESWHKRASRPFLPLGNGVNWNRKLPMDGPKSREYLTSASVPSAGEHSDT
jgi:hypothetical protein